MSSDGLKAMEVTTDKVSSKPIFFCNFKKLDVMLN